MKKMNKQINHNSGNLNKLLNVNKNCLNFIKNEVVLLESLQTQTDFDLHLELKGKRSFQQIQWNFEKNLTWRHQINHVAAKLNRDNV